MSQNIIVGAEEDFNFTYDCIRITKKSRIYLYTDGAYEIHHPDGTMMDIEDLIRYLDENKGKGEDEIERLYEKLVKLNKSEKLNDDFTMLKITFQ